MASGRQGECCGHWPSLCASKACGSTSTVGLGGHIFNRQPITRPQPGNKKTAHRRSISRSSVNRPYASYLGLEIIAKLATVLECEPAELLRVPAPKGRRDK